MKSLKAVLAVTATLATAALLAGCTSQQNGVDANAAPIPKAAKYGTGLAIAKPVSALSTDRLTVVNAISRSVATYQDAKAQQSFTYNNIFSASYDLGANSPYFINKTRTDVTCKPGKAQGTDIGEGFYVVGDTFITPTSGKTLITGTTNGKIESALKQLISQKSIATAYTAARKAAGAYEFKMKDGATVRVQTISTNNRVSMIRVSNVLTSDTCYNLNGLPATTPETVKVWQGVTAKLPAFPLE